ncbi:MAG: FtsQ-type POTRA domain-containing protein [Candidatus Atribacteria bacterium]|nr:FtsQ-type POTRA domain-containing protein [Candidatus Atribacteria bacterium]
MKSRYGNEILQITIFFEALFFYLILGVIAWLIFSLFMRGNLFAVNQIEVIGNQSLSGKYIQSASGIEIGQSIFGLRSWEIENRIRKINDVKSVKVQKVFPHLIRIEIVERTPLAKVVIGDTWFYIDDQGVRVNAPSDNPEQLISLFVPSLENNSILLTLEVIRAWLSDFDTPLKRVKMVHDHLFILQLQNDIFIKCESVQNLKEKISILKPLLREVQIKALKVVGFDLRMKKDIVLIQDEEEVF